jgi:ADP-sugar diphosphatase
MPNRGVPVVVWKEDSIDFFGTDVPVYLPNSITRQELETMPAFKNWKNILHANLALQNTSKDHAFHAHPYSLRSIEVKSVTKFPTGRVGFIKIDAAVERDDFPGDDQERSIPKSLPGTAFLRGGSVAMLMILRPKDSRDERYVILTEQPRLPAGSLQFLEIPAGMLDDSAHFSGAAAKEIEEETGFKIPLSELIDMTELALSGSDHPETNLQKAMYPSPGGCDEYIALFLWEKELDRQEIEDLRGRLTGERTQDEMITLHVKEYEALWRDGARDAKTLAAWALYEGLNRSGELQKFQKRKREGSGSAHSSQERSRNQKVAKR